MEEVQPLPLEVVCDKVYESVCGVDGNTYPNQCFAEDFYGVEIDYAGACVGEDIIIEKIVDKVVEVEKIIEIEKVVEVVVGSADSETLAGEEEIVAELASIVVIYSLALIISKYIM